MYVYSMCVCAGAVPFPPYRMSVKRLLLHMQADRYCTCQFRPMFGGDRSQEGGDLPPLPFEPGQGPACLPACLGCEGLGSGEKETNDAAHAHAEASGNGRSNSAYCTLPQYLRDEHLLRIRTGLDILAVSQQQSRSAA